MERGYYSDSEVTKMDANKKRDEFNIGFKDFEFIKFLGQGAYGGVYLGIFLIFNKKIKSEKKRNK